LLQLDGRHGTPVATVGTKVILMNRSLSRGDKPQMNAK
jgi:hypothetical protein